MKRCTPVLMMCLVGTIVFAACGSLAPDSTVVSPTPTTGFPVPSRVPSAVSVPPADTPIPPASTLGPTPEVFYRYRTPEQVGDGWETDSLEQVGMDPLLLEQMMDALNRLDGDGYNSILVAREGKLVFEAYFRGYSQYHYRYLWFDRDTVHSMQSVTKSVISIW